MENALPVFTGPTDHMRHGFRSLECEHKAPHPVARMQRNANQEFKMKLDEVRCQYGSTLAMKLATEARDFGRPKRVLGLESSSIALDVLQGKDTQIGYSDFLDLPRERAEVHKVRLHDALEVQYGLS